MSDNCLFPELEAKAGFSGEHEKEIYESSQDQNGQFPAKAGF